MTSPPTRPSSAQPGSTYQVGAFALVQQRDTVLLVRPHQLLLPGGPQSLPGLLIDTGSAGMGIVETGLRRTLLSQVGISVSELRLVGSHVLRAGNEQHSFLRLNLIFSTEYCSGILNPQPDELKSALWIARTQLLNGPVQLPEWLRAALQEAELIRTAAPEPAASGGGLGFFGRRRSEKSEK